MNYFNLYYLEPFVRIVSICSALLGIRPVGYSFDGESHDFWEAVFILKGSASVTAGESVFSLNSGSMIFHPPGEFHRIRNKGDESLRIAIVTFGADAFPINTHTICHFSDPKEIFSIVSSIRKVFSTNGIFITGIDQHHNKSDAQLTISALEALFIRILEQHGVSAQTTDAEELSTLYTKAVSVMKNDLEKRLSAKEIADACGMSVSSLQKVFSRYTGGGMMKYYEMLKMHKAKALLEGGALVKEAALRLGYDDPYYFSAAYKRYFGVSPSKQRK